MPVPAVLITQCLQHDFVAPIGRYDTLPELGGVGTVKPRLSKGLVTPRPPLLSTCV